MLSGLRPIAAPTSCPRRITEFPGEISVADGVPVLDVGEHRPHAVLELVAGRPQREVELASFPGEVLGELLCRLLEAVLDRWAEDGPIRQVPMVAEVQPAQRTVLGDERECTDR